MQATILLLVVDDDATIRLVLEEALKDGGFNLELAKDGLEALGIIDRRSGELRGLITDVNLGIGPDGWDIARHARELTPDLPVVYMSGASAQEWSSRGVPNSTVVAKPFAPAQIVTAIAALLNASDAR